jgi:hypothetical protein
MNLYQRARRVSSRTGFFFVTLAAGVLLLASPAGADESGPTVSGDICMQKVFGSPVANSNKLNCTANDIRISKAVSVSPTSCISGQKFDLTATFETIVTANSRYDAGYFFRTDGGTNARGDGTLATGQCSLSALKPPPPANAPVLQLDGDTCGDLNSGTFQVTFVIPDVMCVAAAGTDQLALPNCTSWHSNQGTQCDVGNPFSTNDAADFRPDTKSKCVCDDTFTVPVTVEDAEIVVTKTASPTQVDEPGGLVTFTVDIENAAEFESVDITSIEDDLYGDVGDAGNSGVSDNTCPDLIGVTLGPGETETCMFKAFAGGNAGERVTDVVTVTANQSSTGNDIEDSDDADVDIVDVADEPTVDKTAQSTDNCQVAVTYQVVVNNSSGFDTLTINTLTDDKFGNITMTHAAGSGFSQVVSTTCTLPQSAIDPLSNFTCGFVGRIMDSDCAIDHTNEVTATMTDDDGVNSTKKDTANVTVTATP